MHANTHGAVGVTILTVTYLIVKNDKKAILIGGLLAFSSHYILDFIGESGYKSIKEMVLIEFGIYLYGIILMSSLGKKYLLFTIFGHFMANLMDYIDKKMYLALFLPKEFEITYYFHNKNQVLYPINYKATILAAIFSAILIGICFLILKLYKRKDFLLPNTIFF